MPGCGRCFGATSGGRELFLCVDDLEIDLLTRRVVREGIELDLTKREYELLEYLLRHKNSIVSRDMIARDVWQETSGALTNTIDVYINMLRNKVERPQKRQLIHTVRGVGYAVRDSDMKGMSIRLRLTLWYGLVLAIVLAVFGGAVYVAMRHELLARTDVALGGELDEISEDVQAAKDWTRLSEQLNRRFARHEIYEFQVSRVSG